MAGSIKKTKPTLSLKIVLFKNLKRRIETCKIAELKINGTNELFNMNINVVLKDSSSQSVKEKSMESVRRRRRRKTIIMFLKRMAAQSAINLFV